MNGASSTFHYSFRSANACRDIEFQIEGQLIDLRICFVTSHPPSRGRLSEYSVKVLRELEKWSGIERIYVLSDSEVDGADPLYGSRVEVKRVWRPGSATSPLKILLNILSLRPHLVHFNVAFQSFGRRRLVNFIGLSLPFLCRALGFPSVVSIHNLGERVNLKAVGLKESFLNRLGIRLATKLITLASAVTVTVRSYEDFLRQTYRCGNVEFVPHGTDLIDPPGLAQPNPCRVILLLGHMGPYKGLPLIIDVFKRLNQQRREFKLIVAGESHPNFPGYLDGFKSDAPPNVEFTGYVDEERLPELFERAFVVVLPYLTGTGTSGVFHLACGFGKPIVASDLPEIRELVKEGASAILVSQNDVDGFCKAILRLCDEPLLVEEMCKRNLSFASSESWSSVASSFERIYVRLVAK